ASGCRPAPFYDSSLSTTVSVGFLISAAAFGHPPVLLAHRFTIGLPPLPRPLTIPNIMDLLCASSPSPIVQILRPSPRRFCE
ncbi:MAG: hypothetical protein WB495_25990, partial [Xanthobacteraceae bacterium]